MKLPIEGVAKKLALWHTPTFRPIMDHEELEPIMASAGFAPLRGVPAAAAEATHPATVTWREYAFVDAGAAAAAADGGGGELPRPRLPFPRLDGVHLLAYRAFLEAVEFYLGEDAVPDLFHIRAMPITRAQDRAFERSFRPMADCDMGDEGIYLYREGTLDQITKSVCNCSGSEDASNMEWPNRNKTNNNVALIGKSGNRTSNSICLVPLADLFPSRDVMSLG